MIKKERRTDTLDNDTQCQTQPDTTKDADKTIATQRSIQLQQRIHTRKTNNYHSQRAEQLVTNIMCIEE